MDKRDIIAVIGTRGFPDVQGGVERHCQSLYGLLADYVTPRVYRRKPYVKAAAKHDGIEFVDLPSTRIAGVETLLHTFLCVWHVWRHKPRLVHLHNIGPGVFAPLFKWMGLPVVLTYHSANYEHNKWNRLERAFLRWCECVALRNSDRIIFVNRLQAKNGESVEFDKVLLVDNEGKVQVGTPYVKGAKVTATVLDDDAKAKKVLVFKKIRRKGFQTLNGHRQKLTKIHIDAIA